MLGDRGLPLLLLEVAGERERPVQLFLHVVDRGLHIVHDVDLLLDEPLFEEVLRRVEEAALQQGLGTAASSRTTSGGSTSASLTRSLS